MCNGKLYESDNGGYAHVQSRAVYENLVQKQDNFFLTNVS